VTISSLQNDFLPVPNHSFGIISQKHRPLSSPRPPPGPSRCKRRAEWRSAPSPYARIHEYAGPSFPRWRDSDSPRRAQRISFRFARQQAIRSGNTRQRGRLAQIARQTVPIFPALRTSQCHPPLHQRIDCARTNRVSRNASKLEARLMRNPAEFLRYAAPIPFNSANADHALVNHDVVSFITKYMSCSAASTAASPSFRQQPETSCFL